MVGVNREARVKGVIDAKGRRNVVIIAVFLFMGPVLVVGVPFYGFSVYPQEKRQLFVPRGDRVHQRPAAGVGTTGIMSVRLPEGWRREAVRIGVVNIACPPGLRCAGRPAVIAPLAVDAEDVIVLEVAGLKVTAQADLRVIPLF